MELKEIIDITIELIGEEASQIVEFLYSHPGVSEFEINENLGFPVSQIRSVLYELKAQNLIDYDRRKELVSNFEKVYLNDKRKKLEQFRERLQAEEESTFYMCKNYCTRMPFDQALEQNFSCHVCGSLLNEENKSRKIEMLKRNIAEHEAAIANFKLVAQE